MDDIRADPRLPRILVTTLIALLGVLLVLAVLSFLAAQWRGSGRDPNAVPRTVVPRGDLAGDEETTIELFESASPSVVHINTSSLVEERGWLRSNVYRIPQGSGSGIVWDTAGHIVTNHHVIAGAQQATVTLADQSSWTARLVGSAPDYDLAVLSIQAPSRRLAPLAIGTSAELKVGQNVFAIGNPFGLDQTLTTGVISGLDREIEATSGERIRGVVQTDAAINPGNSGGPLLDSAGRLIGINTSILSPSGAFAGVGFAVPVDAVNRIVPILLRDGGRQRLRPGLGVVLRNDAWSRDVGCGGVSVLEVVEGGSAERAGLRSMSRDADRIALDCIVGMDGEVVRRRADVFRILARHSVGDRVELVVQRGGETLRFEVELQAISG